MRAAELLVKCLENEGVEYIFGIPGEENIDIMDALLESSIKFVTTRHEQCAAFMADASPPVCVCFGSATRFDMTTRRLIVPLRLLASAWLSRNPAKHGHPPG